MGFTECEESDFVTETSCAYRLQCDRQQLWAGCEAGPDGSLQCSCLDYLGGVSFDYRLQDVDFDTACRASLPLCYLNPTLDGLAAACNVEEITSSDAECERSRFCGVPFELPDGTLAQVAATPAALTRSRCFQEEDGVRCTCDDFADPYLVRGADTAVACDVLLDVCAGQTRVGQEYFCEEAQTTLTPCRNERLCGLRTELDAAAGIYALSELYDSASICEGSGITGWQRCACGGPGRFSFAAQVSAESIDADLCAAVDQSCLAAEPLEAGGPVECTELFVPYLNDDTCTFEDWTCTQAARMGPYEARVTGRLQVDCGPSGNSGEWSCYCSSEDKRTSSFTQSGVTTSDACANSFERCKQMVTSSEAGSYGIVYFLFE
jgi:hypothetical protein